MLSVNDLKNIFSVREDKELAVIIGRTPQAVSNWKTSGVPAAIERRAFELMTERGIVAEQQMPYTSQIEQEDVPKVLAAVSKGNTRLLEALTRVYNMDEDELKAYLRQKKEGE